MMSFDNSQFYLFLHVFPLALLIGILFFGLGILVGRLLWRSKRGQAEHVENALQLLEREKHRLQASAKRAVDTSSS